MAKNLLQYVQTFCARTGLPSPASAYGSSDKQISQIVGLLQEFLDDLTTRKWFSENVLEGVFTSVAVELQGAMDTFAPYGFEGIIPGTFWNRTQQQQVLGSVSPSEWQERKASGFSGSVPEYRIRRGNLFMNPIPTAGHSYVFEYLSAYFVRTADGLTRQLYWQADSDIFAGNDRLPLLYLRWAWKKEKGLDYAEEKELYETALESLLARDATPKAVRLDAPTRTASPGIIVPSGSWNIP